MAEAKQPLKLGYWKIRGMAAPIRYVLEYLKVPFENEFYEVTVPDFSREAWLSKKEHLGLEFPNLPYLIDGDLKITDSAAILRYVVNKYGPHLNGKTPEDQAKIDMFFGVMSDIKGVAIMHSYTSGDKEAVNRNTFEKLPAVERYLADKQFVVGDYLTFADFHLMECLSLLNFISGDNKLFETFPNIKAYFGRITEIPEIKEYLESDRFMKRTYNNVDAKINN